MSASTARHAPRAFDGSEARQRFEQEAKVLRQLLASDAGLYVIDAREPVLAKYKDELAVLAGCGKPLLPVLNFVAQPGHRDEEWRQARPASACMHWCASTAWRHPWTVSAGCTKAWRCCWNRRAPSCSD